MNLIESVEREMTAAEFAWVQASYQKHHLELGNPMQTSEILGYVALVEDTFIGCAVGTVETEGLHHSPWCYLSDLFVEKAFRKQGLGAALLGQLEERVAQLGIQNIWTWTAGYEAPGFYQKQGYQVFCELENRYATGHSQVGLRKALRPSSPSLHSDTRPLNVQGGANHSIHVVEREMTQVEFARMSAGFEEHTLEHGNALETAQRHGFVAVDEERFIGCISGLASRNWFSITDLFVDKSYRRQGTGSILLRNMEMRSAALGIKNISVCCASDEAPGFYSKHNYTVSYELENWYPNGHSRLCFHKGLDVKQG